LDSLAGAENPYNLMQVFRRACSVADLDPNPDPDPPDPRVFGAPGSGSGSISQRYGSGSFYH
jgi:hypothetical protein